MAYNDLRNSEQESRIPFAVSPDLWPTSLQQVETGSSLIQEQSHACGCPWSSKKETEKQQGPVEKGIDICFSWSQRYVDNVLWGKQSSPF